jgi:hypothetical protein
MKQIFVLTKILIFASNKYQNMDSFSLLSLTSIAQWILFSGIAIIVIGIIDKKEKIQLAGVSLLFILGVFSCFVLSTNTLSVNASEIAAQSKSAMVLIIYRSLLLILTLSGLSWISKFYIPRFYRVSLFLLIGVSLILFFVLFQIQKTAN